MGLEQRRNDRLDQYLDSGRHALYTARRRSQVCQTTLLMPVAYNWGLRGH